MMKERFAKLLLGEDMSGSGKGVCTALAISNAITNLCGTIRPATITTSLLFAHSLINFIGRHHYSIRTCCGLFVPLDEKSLFHLHLSVVRFIHWTKSNHLNYGVHLLHPQRPYSGSSGGWSHCCRRRRRCGGERWSGCSASATTSSS
jgi:hypothetical protein